jgi:hypothetical protein
MPQSTRPLFEQIDSWLQEIDTVKTAAAPAKPKTAATKKAGPDGMGKSTHPSDDVDDNTQNAETGSRYSENTEDVKRDVPGQAVDETDKNSGGEQDDKQFNIGTNQKATGEDPSTEDDYKSDKDDPGTSHPANADDVGEKYSSMKLAELLKIAEDRAHSILADLANGVGTGNGAPVQTKKAAQATTPPAQSTQQTPPPPPTAPDFTEKAAADFIAQAIRDAELDADLVGSYLHSYHQTRVKAAGEESEVPPDEAGDQEGDEGGAGSVLPPPGAGGDVGDAGGGADVLSALGAGAGGPPPGGEGGDGTPPVGGEGGDAGGPPPGGEGGGMNQEQALQELAMALQELGISPEELAQLAQGQGAKLASAVTTFKRAGKFHAGEAAKTAQQRQARDQIKDYIRELTGSR